MTIAKMRIKIFKGFIGKLGIFVAKGMGKYGL